MRKLRIKDRLWLTHMQMAHKCKTKNIEYGLLYISLYPPPKVCPLSICKESQLLVRAEECSGMVHTHTHTWEERELK